MRFDLAVIGPVLSVAALVAWVLVRLSAQALAWIDLVSR